MSSLNRGMRAFSSSEACVPLLMQIHPCVEQCALHMLPAMNAKANTKLLEINA